MRGAIATIALAATASPAVTAAASRVQADPAQHLAARPTPGATLPPFGKLACGPVYGIRLCTGGQEGDRDLRVPSFDGVPLDADLALPATGKGPFPLIVLLHGLGGSKGEFEVTSDDGGIDDVSLADRGYAVLMYTARGFGDSCGTAASRVGTPACAKGWIQLADQRYEARDTQYLSGLLVDEGLAEPAIAVAGVSYGAGQSLELAMLKNRIRLPDGRFARFTSPGRHVPMRVAAAYAMWPWDDLVTALVPNGRLSSTVDTPARADRVPAGVDKESWNTLLYGVSADFFLAPPGTDPQSDLTGWYHELSAGEPYTAADRKALKILQDDKSAIGIPMAEGGPAPTAIQSGWTDSLFPVSEAMHYANRVEGANRGQAAGKRAPLLLLFDDVGHGWAQDKLADIGLTDERGTDFLDAVMLGHRRPETGVVALPTTCPSTAPSGPPVEGASLTDLAPHRFRLSGRATQTVTSSGGDPAVAAALDPAGSQKLCDPIPDATEPGTAVYRRAAGADGTTLLGPVQIRARIAVTGNYPELVGRLWDVGPDGSRQIVAMGVYRPSVNQAAGTEPSAKASATVSFQLNPNDYRFAPGDTIELELVGANPPYFRQSNGTFQIAVHGLTATLPTR
ncbi:MAG TPA: CocE/NonD family hydrolase C-terminal non-catalytic domain-containing protein [Acidimicrobiales bacterium]|nr:CocE/NonD family hydrolase C-terminal non-catalytic domain-containing protein [Acidimicrobiales bacterium]